MASSLSSSQPNLSAQQVFSTQPHMMLRSLSSENTVDDVHNELASLTRQLQNEMNASMPSLLTTRRQGSSPISIAITRQKVSDGSRPTIVQELVQSPGNGFGARDRRSSGGQEYSELVQSSMMPSGSDSAIESFGELMERWLLCNFS